MVPRDGPAASGYAAEWYAPRAAGELLAFRELVGSDAEELSAFAEVAVDLPELPEGAG